MAGQARLQGPIPDLCSMEKLLQAPTDGVGDAIVVPLILANQFELKICLLNLVTAIAFHGFKNDDPHSHIRRFTKITQTVKLYNVPSDVVKLLLFPLSLEGAARTWIEKEPPNSITTCNDLDSLNSAANGNSLTKNTQEALTIIENKYKVQASRNKTQVASASGSSTQDAHVTALTKQVEALLSSFNQPVNSVPNGCETCGGPHPYYECQTAGGYTQDVYANSGTYNQGGNAHQPQGGGTRPEDDHGLDSFRNLAEALSLMPTYHKMLKDLLFDKEKLLGLSNTSLTENCSVVLLKKLPKKLRDPGRFLIPCDFHRLESCMALADLGASINLMPLYVWKKLSLLDLTPTRMTLELATRETLLEDDPALVDVHEEELILRDSSKHHHKHGNESINMINFIDITCEDHFLEVLKFKKSNQPSNGSTTPLSDSLPSLTPFETSDSLLEDFTDELALLEPFPLRNKKLSLPDLTPTRITLELATRETLLEDDPALVDVHGEELILRDGSKHPHKHRNKSINMINFIDITCEDRFPEVLKFKKSNHPSNGSTTPLFDSLPSLTPFETSDSLLEEFTDELALLDLFPPRNEDDNFDPEADLRKIEYLFNQDPSTESSPKSDIDIIDLVLERFTDKPTLVYTPPPGDDDDDHFDLKNEDKVFNPGILILGRTQIFNDESKDKDYKERTSSEALLIIDERNFLSIYSDQEPLFFLELTVIETLLSFSFKNEISFDLEDLHACFQSFNHAVSNHLHVY
nr:reverse transcriptase domain-containing protein [Tanacetum cinerariifolium]